MAQLPLESPGGLSFTLGADTSGVKLSSTAGVYSYDVPNGTVNVAQISDSLRGLTLVAAAESGNVIPVTVTLLSSPTGTAALLAKERIQASILGPGSHGATFSASTSTGDSADLAATGTVEFLLDTDTATGTAVINVGTSQNTIVYLTVRTLAGAATTIPLSFA